MTTTKTKRGLAILLVCMMLLVIFPGHAFGAAAEEEHVFYITGNVWDSHMFGEPVPGATVILYTSTQSVVTESCCCGWFMFMYHSTGPDQQSFWIQVYADGFSLGGAHVGAAANTTFNRPIHIELMPIAG